MKTHYAAAMRIVSIAVAALACSSAADAAIYKCIGSGASVLYSDIPCKGGSVVDVRAGIADPGAIERLQRERVEFDRNMLARRAADDAVAMRRAALDAQMREAEAAQRTAEAAAYPPPQYYVPAYGVVAPRMRRHPHSHPIARTARHGGPARTSKFP
jgi:hypothetical protein